MNMNHSLYIVKLPMNSKCTYYMSVRTSKSKSKSMTISYGYTSFFHITVKCLITFDQTSDYKNSNSENQKIQVHI